MYQLSSPQAVPWDLMVLWLLCHPACGDLGASGALNGVLCGHFAGIPYGDPTSFLELWKGEALDAFTEDPTDLQPFIKLGTIFLFLLLPVPRLSPPLPVTLTQNALAFFVVVFSIAQGSWKTLARKGGSLQATSASALQPTLWQGSAEGLVIRS